MSKTKISIISALLSQIIASNANAHDGFYLSGGFGLGLIDQAKRQTFRSNISSTLITTFTSHDKISDKSLKGDMGIGYDYDLGGDVVFAIEGRVGYINFDEKNTLNSRAVVSGSVVNLSSAENLIKSDKISAGLLFKPGYKISDTSTLRGIVGTEFLRLKSSTNASYYQDISGTIYISKVSGSTKSNNFGLAMGLGFEEEISQDTILGMEFIHTYYGKVKGAVDLRSQITQAGTPSGSLTLNDKISVNTNSFMVRLNYKF